MSLDRKILTRARMLEESEKGRRGGGEEGRTVNRTLKDSTKRFTVVAKKANRPSLIIFTIGQI